MRRLPGLAPTDASVQRSSTAVWAADAYFAELADPQLVVTGEALPTVG